MCAAFVAVVSPITRPDAGVPPCPGEPGDRPRLPGAGRPDQDVDRPPRGQHPVRCLRLVISQARTAQRRLAAAGRTGRAGAPGGRARATAAPRCAPGPRRAARRRGPARSWARLFARRRAATLSRCRAWRGWCMISAPWRRHRLSPSARRYAAGTGTISGAVSSTVSPGPPGRSAWLVSSSSRTVTCWPSRPPRWSGRCLLIILVSSYRENVALPRCASATAAASDPPQARAGRRPRRPPGAAPAKDGVRDSADSASVSARRDWVSQCASSVSRDGAECAFARRESSVTNCAIDHTARASGARPCLRSYSSVSCRTRGPIARRREENWSRTACEMPAISHPFPSARATVCHAEPGRQVLGQGPLRDRARGRFRRVQRRAVQGAPGPPVTGPGRQRVLALDPVEDRVVHVQLRVMVPAGVLRERRDHPLMRVHEPAGPLAVVTRPAVTGLALQVLQHRLVPGHDRVPHHLRPPSPLPRLDSPASFPGLLGPDLQRRVQQADRLGHRERRIEEVHRGALVLQRLHDDLVPALLQSPPARPRAARRSARRSSRRGRRTRSAPARASPRPPDPADQRTRRRAAPSPCCRPASRPRGPARGQPRPVQIPGGSPCSATADR